VIDVKVQCGNCKEWIPKEDRTCPNCGVHQHIKRRGRGGGDHAEHDTRCAWNINGERCRYPGTTSASTNGNGPWYCAGHFGLSNTHAGAEIVQASARHLTRTPEERAAADLASLNEEAAQYCAERGLDTVAKMREFARTAFQPRKPSTAWAEKILERARTGDPTLPALSVELAKKALRIQDDGYREDIE
jgi:hypothetical protein